jgi:hypothetical protein
VSSQEKAVGGGGGRELGVVAARSRGETTGKYRRVGAGGRAEAGQQVEGGLRAGCCRADEEQEPDVRKNGADARERRGGGAHGVACNRFGPPAQSEGFTKKHQVACASFPLNRVCILRIYTYISRIRCAWNAVSSARAAAAAMFRSCNNLERARSSLHYILR